jgi:predicted nucleic acid-binding protein
VAGITYDAGALIAAEREPRTLWALHRRALERGLRPTVPAGALAQAWRGGPQAELSRLLKGCRIEDFDEVRARAAGQACGRAQTSDVIDATVVVGAIARGDLVVTSDRKDLDRIASSLGTDIRIVAV